MSTPLCRNLNSSVQKSKQCNRTGYMAKYCPSSWFKYFHLFHSIWMRRSIFSYFKLCWAKICREGVNHILMKIFNYDILQNLGKVGFDLRFGWLVGLAMCFGGIFSSSLSPVNNLSDLCWVKNRAEISNIFLKRSNSFMLLQKHTFLFALPFQKFPLYQ